MELDKLKEIVRFAKRNRIKSITVDGFSLELAPRKKKKIQAPIDPQPSKPIQTLPPIPTLDQINDWIHNNPEEQDQ